MIKLLLTFLLSVGLLTLAACSKKLDDASAVELTQSFVDAQGGRAVTTAAADLTNRLDSELPEALQMPGMRRLISRGWIEERKSVVSYPNFSGKFSGVTHVDYEIGRAHV